MRHNHPTQLTTAQIAAILLCGPGAALLCSVKPASAQGNAPPNLAKDAPAVYALVLVDRVQPIAADVSAEAAAQELATYKRTVAALVPTRRVLKSVVGNQELAALPPLKEQSDPVAWLQSALVIDMPADTNLVRIGINGQDKESLAKVVSAVVRSWSNVVRDPDDRGTILRLDRLQRSYEENVERLAKKVSDADNLARQVGLDETAATRATQKLALLHQEEREIHRQRLAAEWKLRREEIKYELTSDTSTQRQAIADDIKKAEREKQFWELKTDFIAQQIQDFANNTSRVSTDLVMRRQEIDTLKDTVGRLARQYAAESIEQRPLYRIQIIEDAAGE